ncbi:hypothetical protein C8R47DRAFT_1081791 [Mycena vitilis]|nr:hypothetical protein C8R47DRAFT_1081791 [Mycena vitilis]
MPATANPASNKPVRSVPSAPQPAREKRGEKVDIKRESRSCGRRNERRNAGSSFAAPGRKQEDDQLFVVDEYGASKSTSPTITASALGLDAFRAIEPRFRLFLSHYSARTTRLRTRTRTYQSRRPKQDPHLTVDFAVEILRVPGMTVDRATPRTRSRPSEVSPNLRRTWAQRIKAAKNQDPKLFNSDRRSRSSVFALNTCLELRAGREGSNKNEVPIIKSFKFLRRHRRLSAREQARALPRVAVQEMGWWDKG